MTRSAEVLLHPVRMRIVQSVAGRRRTAAEIAEDLGDVPQATLYRQIGALSDAGVLAVSETRAVRGATERIYVLAEGMGRVTPEEVAAAGPDDHLRWFTVFAAGLIGDFARYLDRGAPDPVADGVGYRQVPLYLSDVELAELAGRLSAAIAPVLANGPGEGRRRRMLSTVLIPAD